jgi:hypothetical protein
MGRYRRIKLYDIAGLLLGHLNKSVGYYLAANGG